MKDHERYRTIIEDSRRITQGELGLIEQFGREILLAAGASYQQYGCGPERPLYDFYTTDDTVMAEYRKSVMFQSGIIGKTTLAKRLMVKLDADYEMTIRTEHIDGDIQVTKTAKLHRIDSQLITNQNKQIGRRSLQGSLVTAFHDDIVQYSDTWLEIIRGQESFIPTQNDD